MESHLRGAQHMKVLRNRAAVNDVCWVCNMTIGTNATMWAQHLSGKRHIKNAANVEPTSGKAGPPDSDTWCNVCSARFTDRRAANAHRRSEKHKRKVALLKVGGKIKESQKSKHGVALSHDSGIVEIPFVDIQTLVDQPLRTTDIVIAARSHHCRLTSVRFLSTGTSVGRQSSFYVGVTPPVRLHVDDNFNLPIIFEAGELRGYFTDTVELSFDNTESGQEWKVSRTIRTTVGVASDYALLRPAAPYVRRPRRAITRIRQPLPGPLPPSRATVPYVKALPPYPLNDDFATLGPLNQRIASVQAMLPATLNGQTYKDLWSALLFVEEHQMRVDIEEYDLVGVPLTQVPGLAEKRPSVLVGDSVHLSLQHNPNQWFDGRVHAVRDKEVGLRFHERFAYQQGELCEARFTVPRIPIRRMHLAVNSQFCPDRVLFPDSTHIRGLLRPSASAMDQINTFNPLIASNPAQLEAVASIVNRPAGAVPFVIWGPPGTGKTITVVEAIRQVLAKNPNARILACAPSNSAADLIAQRLTSLGRNRLFRMNAPSRFTNRLPDDLRDFVYKDRDGYFTVQGAQHLKQFSVVVSTCLSASIPFGVGVEVGHFSHIFIDEAGQAMEPEIMVPIKTMADDRTTIVLSGDPKQLGPIVRSAVASHLGLATSFLNRLVDREVYSNSASVGVTMVKLTKNWRSHDAILRFPNETFYNGELEACAPCTVIDSLLESPVLARKNFPVVFHGIAGLDDREAGSPSYFNIDEISLICKYVDELRSDRVRRLTDHDIGVISPYNAQGKKLRRRLDMQYQNIKVGSVEEFQGQERTVILITTVRSQVSNVAHDLKHILGFLVNPRRMNVALTRAKALLVVVGNPSILGLDPLWRKFLNYVHRNGGWKGLQPNWDPKDDSPDGATGLRVERAVGDEGLTEMELLAEQLKRQITLTAGRDGDGDEDYDEERREANEDRGPWIRRDDE
ncbi:hypothetical protein FRC04_010319 [Tulasnella sp. 424]|nr:hypothetical protein FRC04_010319 [Tulasnella sp. 424]KAG8978740.1 hypothetical protein FRC05_010014 [Tulasnella sp. 425]